MLQIGKIRERWGIKISKLINNEQRVIIEITFLVYQELETFLGVTFVFL